MGDDYTPAARYCDQLVYGREPVCVPDIVRCLQQAHSEGFSFCVVPICHARNRRTRFQRGAKAQSVQILGDHAAAAEGVVSRAEQPWTRSDALLTSEQWTSTLVPRLSPWLALDAVDPAVRGNSEQVFWEEIRWAAHLNSPAVIMPPPNFSSQRGAAHYAHICAEVAHKTSALQMWVPVPVTKYVSVPTRGGVTDLRAFVEKVAEGFEGADLDMDGPETNEEFVAVDTWAVWNKIRCMCEGHPRVSVILELTDDLDAPEKMERWLGEVISAVQIPTSVFLTNDKGYPVLSRAHQEFLKSLFRLKPEIIITGTSHHSADGSLTLYMQYIEHLRKQIPPMTPQEQFESPYYDYLQIPLQPLGDNLESQTYETFEKDPVKYVRYREAIEAAIKDMVNIEHRPTPLTLMVVGAGRGPLVHEALTASKNAGIPLTVYAVEKNPNAIVTLRNRKISQNWTNVTIVDSDMRYWDAPTKADILVSELLGSFSDNELSPECLDGAQKFLKDDGISIPCEYTSHIAPLASQHIYNDIRAFGDPKNLELPYIVRWNNAYQPFESKPCFTFVHPNRPANGVIDNSRYTSCTFEAKFPMIVHGVTGYFTTTLYKDITLSINPQSFSEGMFSWFPIFFPIKTPITFNTGDKFDIHFWREIGVNKVWYEWSITGPTCSAVHNVGGRCAQINM